RSTGLRLHDINCGLKAYRREVTDSLHIYGELYRFIPVLAVSKGFSVTELPTNHRPRQYGKSKYGASRFLRGLLDLITVIFLTRFLKRPLHLFGTIGFLLTLAGIVISVYLTIIHFAFHKSVGDRPLLLFGILFIISGIQLISTGLIAELITYYQQERDGR
ncbi:glycosyltransferase, partial [Patescibacteria group bacterium]|nr:glycosyltransferase [Patescibacteria group bacterium]